MKQYHQALEHILANGKNKTDRTGVGTRSVFGYQMRFNLQEGFPATTTKKLAWRAVVSELLWFLEGSSDERRLAEILHGTRDSAKKTIWTANAEAPYWQDKARFLGDLGQVYGVQWRNFGGVDQVLKLIDDLKTNPDSRRHIISAWNVPEIPHMALPPCHVMAQFDVTDGYLSCQLYQRSCDMFLGVPFNIASYALLTHILARECGLKVGDFVWTGGDCHIYNNHFDAVAQQLAREPKQLPTLMFTADKKIADYIVDDFLLDNYNPDTAIAATMAV